MNFFSREWLDHCRFESVIEEIESGRFGLWTDAGVSGPVQRDRWEGLSTSRLLSMGVPAKCIYVEVGCFLIARKVGDSFKEAIREGLSFFVLPDGGRGGYTLKFRSDGGLLGMEIRLPSESKNGSLHVFGKPAAFSIVSPKELSMDDVVTESWNLSSSSVDSDFLVADEGRENRIDLEFEFLTVDVAERVFRRVGELSCLDKLTGMGIDARMGFLDVDEPLDRGCVLSFLGVARENIGFKDVDLVIRYFDDFGDLSREELRKSSVVDYDYFEPLGVIDQGGDELRVGVSYGAKGYSIRVEGEESSSMFRALVDELDLTC